MKRSALILALVLVIVMPTLAQRNALNKISPELREEMSRKDSHDNYSIIIVMSDQYNQFQLSKQVQYLGKSERRSFVIQELQNFSKANQYDLLLLCNEAAKTSIVKDVKSFWLFNGISCTTNREMIESLSQRNDIAFIDLDRIVMLPEDEESVETNEHSRSIAWHVSQVRANDVWNYNGASGFDGTGVIVAIIDTGINYNHLDLADHMWDGGPDYPNHGYDFYDDDNDPMDEYGHGSHCAGITAGDGTSGTQTGIAPNATIMALKVFGASGEATTDVILEAMSFAVEHGADVVNMSLGSSGASGNAYYRTAFINMMNANVVASVSAGNYGERYSEFPLPVNIGSPGNCPSPWHNPDQTLSGGQSAVITIGASNRNDRKATFSSFGPVTWSDVSDYSDYPYTEGSTTNIGLIKPDIIVPGAAIISCDYSTNDNYATHMGTSMATPLASGIMALMLQADPNLTPSRIDEILETTALPVDFRVTKNNYTGAGRADALNCIDAIFTAASQPTNLNLETCGGNVTLTWAPGTTAPNGYCIYRDNVQVGTTTETLYTDVNVGTGKHVYYVRANDNNDHQSIRSNAVLCLIEPYANIPDDLTISWDGTDATLNWDASITSCNDVTSTNLSFNMVRAGGYPSNSTLFWGIKYEPEDLRNYIGMSIDQISVIIYSTNLTHTLRIYRGNSYGNTTGVPVYTQSFTPTCGQWGTETVTLDTPYVIDDISEDLWITCSATPESPDTNLAVAVIGFYDGHTSNCFYLSTSSDPNNVVWKHVPDGGSDYAACISAHLTRTTIYSPTYNLYLDNNSVASNLSDPTYTDAPALHSGNNIYHVTSTIGNNESCPSNNASIVVVDNNLTENNLTIDESLVYLIEDGGILTANSTLSSTDPNRLIINDGGHLINSSTGVQATVKKDITAYSGDEDGWYFIASPVTESFEPTAANGLLTNNYDLFTFDQSEALEWRNYEANPKPFTTIDHKAGYLYANNINTTLSFAGTLAASTEGTPLVYDANATFKGFNLIGNPYPCNTTISRDFYIISGNTVTLAESGRQIAPCEGVFVKASGANEAVAFTKVTSATSTNSKDCFDMVVAQGKANLDRARVRLNDGIGMEKFSLDDKHSQISFQQNGQDFAVAYANGANEMPVSFKASQNGTYTLNIESESLVLDYLHLIDNLTGSDIDLLVTPSYAFEAKTSDYESRFKLVFVANEDGPSTGSGTDGAFAFISDGNIVVNQEGSVQIVDMTGRVVYQGDAMNRVSTANMNAGVYVLRLINGEKVKTQKIVLP